MLVRPHRTQGQVQRGKYHKNGFSFPEQILFIKSKLKKDFPMEKGVFSRQKSVRKKFI